jgi:hypothetical protein
MVRKTIPHGDHGEKSKKVEKREIQNLRVLRRKSIRGGVNTFSFSHSGVTWLTALAPDSQCNTSAMPFQNDEILCPLCHGHGHERKELLVLRSRSREFQQELQNFADEVAFGNTSGLKDPYRKEERVYSNESD